MTPQEMSDEARRLSGLLDAALSFLKEQIKDAAEAERDYRKGKSEAWLRAPEGNVAQREAWVDGHTADLRYKRDIGVGMERAAREAIQSRRAQISLLQSVASAHRAEAEFVKYGPSEAA